MLLSVVIPSYKDPLLNKTVASLLENSELPEDQLEIICVMDGYWQAPVDDPRVKVVHLGKNRGMREAINAGVALATGTFILRTDEHCMFGPGYDRILTENIEENWIVTPRRLFLDVTNWTVMDIPPVDFMRLKIVGQGPGRKFSGVERPGDDAQPIQESEAMQGSCWIMRKAHWEKVIGSLETEGYGPHYQDSHEMVFKTWQAGGKLMVNKKTWYAHKHRDFPRTHNNGTKENPSNNEQCWAHSLNVWESYYNERRQTHKI